MPKGFQPLSPEEDERRLALWRQGLTDREIGAILGLSRDAIASWRRARNVPAHVRPDNRGGGRKPQAKRETEVTEMSVAIASRPRRPAVEFRPVIRVDIATGRLSVLRDDSWWPVWRGEEAS